MIPHVLKQSRETQLLDMNEKIDILGRTNIPADSHSEPTDQCVAGTALVEHLSQLAESLHQMLCLESLLVRCVA